MKNIGAPNSFFKALQQKYKKNHPEVTPAEDADSVASAAESPQETTLRDSPIITSESKPEDSPTYESKITLENLPPDKLYLKPLYILYLHCLEKGILQGEPMEILDFETHLLSPVTELPNYNGLRVAVKSFSKIVSAEAYRLLNDWGVAEEPKVLTLVTEEVPPTLTEEMLPETEGEDIPETEGEDIPETEGEDIPEIEGNNLPETNTETDPQEADIEMLPEPETPMPEPQAAFCKQYTTSDKMNAFIFAFPSNVSENPLTADSLNDFLAKESILWGINETLLGEMLDQQRFFQILPIAQGALPTNGEDGYIVPQVDCSKKIEISQNEQGVSDFKNLNFVRNAIKGDTLCAIIPATEGTPGTNIHGAVHPPRKGRPAPSVVGKNTVLSEDKTRLLAEIDGQIVLNNKMYSIEPLLVIRGNVDYGVGNLAFAGHIIVNGDVTNGFTVNAGGDITVHGIVEGANIVSGGDVVLSKGIKGNFHGLVDAKGTVRTTFIENCTVSSGGDLYADSIINCKVLCGGSVYATSRHGTIVGGSITAFHSVEAKLIGAQSRRETDITLGEAPHLIEKRTSATEELQTVLDSLIPLNKNLGFLTASKDRLSHDKLEILKQLQLQSHLYESRKTELEEILAEIPDTSVHLRECSVKCSTLLPPTKITIGPEVLLIKDSKSQCRIALTDDGIIIGLL